MIPLAWQQEVMASPARFKVVAGGRRVGKDTFIALEGFRQAMVLGKRVGVICPNDHMATFTWRQFRDYEATQYDFFPSTPGYFEVGLEANRRAILDGEPNYIMVNEAAMCDQEVWSNLLAPYSETHPNCRFVFLGTPLGLNWFWSLYGVGLDPAHTEWQSWRFPTTVNLYLSPQSVEQSKQDMPELYEQEILAEFTEVPK